MVIGITVIFLLIVVLAACSSNTNSNELQETADKVDRERQVNIDKYGMVERDDLPNPLQEALWHNPQDLWEPVSVDSDVVIVKQLKPNGDGDNEVVTLSFPIKNLVLVALPWQFDYWKKPELVGDPGSYAVVWDEGSKLVNFYLACDPLKMDSHLAPELLAHIEKRVNESSSVSPKQGDLK